LLFGKFFLSFPVCRIVASIAIVSAGFSAKFTGFGTTDMAAIVGTIGESF